MLSRDYRYSFSSSQTGEKVFDFLTDPSNWWVGLYGESIVGKSQFLGDEFEFRAGYGLHYSKQQLEELIPNEKVVWLITESALTFLNNSNEWAGTKIGFEIENLGEATKIHFFHIGLIPEIECYEVCSNAWKLYLNKLQEILR